MAAIPKHPHRVAAELAAAGDRVDDLVNLRPGSRRCRRRAVPLRLRGRGLWATWRCRSGRPPPAVRALAPETVLRAGRGADRRTVPTWLR